MNSSIKVSLVTLAILTTFCCMAAKGQKTNTSNPTEQKQPSYNVAALYQEVRQLARRYYPDVTSHRLGDKIHFEHNTRIFIVHEAWKTGEWQDPWEERGPKLGGIHCDISITPGHYSGAAVVPQSFDKRYFTAYLMAPYSKELDAHLHILIKHPRNVPDGFIKDMVGLLNNFGKYVVKTLPE